jgi:hypothetical protein
MMFRWLKNKLSGWLERRLSKELKRLQAETQRLKEELERETGKPVELSHEAKLRLAEKSHGLDPKFLKQNSVVDPEELAKLRQQAEKR